MADINNLEKRNSQRRFTRRCSDLLGLEGVLPVVEVRVCAVPLAEDNHPRFYIVGGSQIEAIVVELLQEPRNPGVNLLLPGSDLFFRFRLLEVLAHGLHKLLKIAHESLLCKLCLRKIVAEDDVDNLFCVLVLLIAVGNYHLPLNDVEEVVGGGDDCVAKELIPVYYVLVNQHAIFFSRNPEDLKSAINYSFDGAGC
eukprot:XP_001708021.1 Hypothetical protein GL50803_6243 [Giardia lamblia ATCC 50803]